MFTCDTPFATVKSTTTACGASSTTYPGFTIIITVKYWRGRFHDYVCYVVLIVWTVISLAVINVVMGVVVIQN